jgi:hypothetical protein
MRLFTDSGVVIDSVMGVVIFMGFIVSSLCGRSGRRPAPACFAMVHSWWQAAHRRNQCQIVICSENGSTRVSVEWHLGQGTGSSKISKAMTASLSIAS